MYEDKKRKAWGQKNNMNKLKQMGKKMNGKEKKGKRKTKQKEKNIATHLSLHDRSDTEV